MALEDRTRSPVMADASPLISEQISEYASLNPYTRSWENPREHVTIKQIVEKGTFGQVAKATAIIYKLLFRVIAFYITSP